MFIRNLKHWVFFLIIQVAEWGRVLELKGGGSQKGRGNFQFSKVGQGAPPSAPFYSTTGSIGTHWYTVGSKVNPAIPLRANRISFRTFTTPVLKLWGVWPTFA